ncbi:MAG TPA: ABC transporter permease [Bacteroidota bacterium]|nr:ABC transporter permease [Bacteroidota bacterium]
MRASLAVIGEMVRKEFYQIRQDRRMLAVSVVAPFVMVLLLGYAATTDITNSTLAVCDMDRTAASRAFVRNFTNTTYFIGRYAVDDPAALNPLVEEGKANIALVIPDGFSRKQLAGETAQVQVILDGTDANTANILLGYAQQIVASYAQGVTAQYLPLLGAARVGRIVPEPRIWFNPDLLSAYYMVPGVVALVLMIITMTLTSLGIVKEKEIGTLEQLMVTPIRSFELILGKLLPFTVIGFVDVVIVLAIARFWFGVPMVGAVPLVFALSALFILTTLGLGLFISTVARSQQQAMLIAQFFFFMPFLFLSGFAFPIANMPRVIQWVTYIIPLRYFLEIVRGVFLKGSGLAELWAQALALLAIGATILTLSVLRFHKTLE